MGEVGRKADINMVQNESVAQSCPTLWEPTRLLCPMEFSGQENWRGWPLPSLEDLPNPGTEPGSPTLQTLYLLSHHYRLTKGLSRRDLR